MEHPLPRARGGGSRWERLAPGLPYRHLELLELAGPDDLDGWRGADLDLPKPHIQVLQALGDGAVQGHQRVALHQPGLVGRTLWLDRDDQQATVLIDPSLDGVGQRHFLGADPEIGPLDASLGAQARPPPLGDTHRDRPSVAAAEAPAVHADRAAVDIDERTTAETRVERRVGLDQVLDLAPAPSAPGRGDGADGAERRLEVARPADREDDLARLQVIHLRARHRWGRETLDLQQRHIGRGVAPDKARLAALVVDDHLDIFLLLDDVVGGQDEAAVPNDAGARPAAARVDPNHALARLLDELFDILREIFQSCHESVAPLNLDCLSRYGRRRAPDFSRTAGPLPGRSARAPTPTNG